MRIRTIKPEFWESENLGGVSRDARLLFIGLFSCCDDSGRTRAASRLLASRIFPYDDDALRLLPKWIAELEAKKCIRVYVVDGETYIDIPKWLSHQKIDKPSPSKLPEFREDSRGFEKNSLGTGNREQGTGNTIAPPSGSEQQEVLLVDHKSTPKPKRHRDPDPIFDSIAQACGMAGKVNDMNAGQIAVAKKNILQACLGGITTPEEIHRRAENYRHLWPSMSLTPTALAKHWVACERGTAEPVRVSL